MTGVEKEMQDEVMKAVKEVRMHVDLAQALFDEGERFVGRQALGAALDSTCAIEEALLRIRD